MKHLSCLLCILTTSFLTCAQNVSVPPQGENQQSLVKQWIGLAEVSVLYHSPDVHGPSGLDRKGHIWGELVPYGLTDYGVGLSSGSPWRAGANENTVITFSEDVVIEGKSLKKGSYGLFLLVEKEKPWTWIFSNNSSSWGSYFYDEKEDALRVQAAVSECPYTEWLTYGFDDRLQNSAMAYLQWENKRAGFKVEVPNGNELYFNKIANELRTSTGFDYHSFIFAARFTLETKTHMDQGLSWIKIATERFGAKEFSAMQIKSELLAALGRTRESEEVVNIMVNDPSATAQDIYGYGRELQGRNQDAKALEIFKLNQKRNPKEVFLVNLGLARGYSKLGDKPNAIKHWELAIKNIPQDRISQLSSYQMELEKLKQK